MPASEKKVWLSRVEKAHEDAVQAAQSVENDGISRAGTAFWADNASNRNSTDLDHPGNDGASTLKKLHLSEYQFETDLAEVSLSNGAKLLNAKNSALPPPPPFPIFPKSNLAEERTAPKPPDEVVHRESWDHFVASSQANPSTTRFMSIPQTLPSVLLPQVGTSFRSNCRSPTKYMNVGGR